MKTGGRAALLTLGVVIGVAVAAGLVVIFTGAYNVAATKAHWPVTEWVFETVQRNSVSARAPTVTLPAPDDSAALARGFEHFRSMCVQCHGAPGVDRGEVGQGLNPRPPRLEEAASRWTDGELYWMTRRGIRMTGMPAFGRTHSDEEIRAIVAFVRRLEDMTAEEYARWVRRTSAGNPTHTH